MWFSALEMHMEHLASLVVFFLCVARAKQIASKNMSSGAHCAERACLGEVNMRFVSLTTPGEVNVRFISLLSPFDRTQDSVCGGKVGLVT